MRILLGLLALLSLAGTIALLAAIAFIEPTTSFSPDDQMVFCGLGALVGAGLGSGLIAYLKRARKLPVSALGVLFAALLWMVCLGFNLRVSDERSWGMAAEFESPTSYIEYLDETAWLEQQVPRWFFRAVTDAEAHQAAAPDKWEALAYAQAMASTSPDLQWRYVVEARRLGRTDREAEMLTRLDDFLFARAKRPPQLRDYIKSRYYKEAPRRHLADAQAKLAALYEEEARGYLSRASLRGADPEAAAGIRDLLRHLGRQYDAPAVNVCFEAPKTMDAASLEGLRRVIEKVTGSEHVQPVSLDFGKATTKRRNQRIFEEIKKAFNRQFDRDFMLVWDCVGRGPPRLDVAYGVGPGLVPFVRKAEAKLPAKDRTVYPAVKIDFSFSIDLGKDSAAHRFALSMSPAPDFSVGHRKGRRVRSETVYRKMTATAFDEFERKLLKAYGLVAPAR